jgi:hypothetical protein
MVKRLMYIVCILIGTSRLSFAASVGGKTTGGTLAVTYRSDSLSDTFELSDTLKVKKPNQDPDDKKKIKEIAKAKKQAKPEKLGTQQPADTLINKERLKLKRQRRPEGLERPPEIPRRNNN